MIDWVSLAFNTLWILGLSGLLAALSAAYFTGQAQAERLHQVLSRPGYKISSITSLILFCLGLAGGAQTALERMLWIALAGFWGILIVFGVRRLQPGPKPRAEDSGH